MSSERFSKSPSLKETTPRLGGGAAEITLKLHRKSTKCTGRSMKLLNQLDFCECMDDIARHVADSRLAKDAGAVDGRGSGERVSLQLTLRWRGVVLVEAGDCFAIVDFARHIAAWRPRTRRSGDCPLGRENKHDFFNGLLGRGCHGAVLHGEEEFAGLGVVGQDSLEFLEPRGPLLDGVFGRGCHRVA